MQCRQSDMHIPTSWLERLRLVRALLPVGRRRERRGGEGRGRGGGEVVWEGERGPQRVDASAEEELGGGVEGESRDQLLEVEGDVLLSALPDLAESNV